MRYLIPYIKKSNIAYVNLVLFLLLGITLGACTTTIFEELPDKNDNIVHLSITRSQGSNISINQDYIDYEDRVHNLAMLVFDSNTGDLVCNHFESAILQQEVSKTFKVEMIPGQRDLYFIANVSFDELKTITHRQEAISYLTRLNKLPENLFIRASATEGFPMSAIYHNQRIEGGGTENSPRPFRPNNQNAILLQRVVAKIDVAIQGAAASYVKKIEYINGVDQYSMQTLTNDDGKTRSTRLFNKVAENTYRLYIPEVIFDENTTLNTADTKNINSIKITFKNNKTRLVPIVSNGENFQESYISFAKGEEQNNEVTPDYNIYRNKNYQLDLNLTATEKELKVAIKVLPWTYQDSQFDFGQPEYKIEVESIANEQTILLPQQAKAKVKFKLTSPAGALWQASVTNGLFFEFLEVPESELNPDEISGSYGIANNDKSYVFYIAPSQPYNYITRYTELYITVNKKEIPLLESSDGGEVGTNYRYIFKQVE